MNRNQVIIYIDQYRYEFTLGKEKTYRIGHGIENDWIVPHPDMPICMLTTGEDQWTLMDQTGAAYSLKLNEKNEWQEGEFPFVCYPITDLSPLLFDPLIQDQLYISNETGSDFQIKEEVKLLLTKEATNWQAKIIAGTVYHNNLRVNEATIRLEKGDELSYGGNTFKFFAQEIHLNRGFIQKSSLKQVFYSIYAFNENYPDYHRSPRIIYRENEDKMVINAPADEPAKPTDQLIKAIIPPVIMMAVTIAMAIVQPRGLYVLVSVATTVVSIIFSISGYIKSRKQYKQDLSDRTRLYNEALKEKATEVYAVNQEQRDGQLYHYPAIQALHRMTAEISPRIYEKNQMQFDFLYYRLGLGEVKASTEFTFSKADNVNQKDPLEKQGYDLYQTNLRLENMPIITKLTQGPVGYIGPRKLVIEQLQLLVQQLSVFHSYHDLQFISIFPENEYEEWKWMRWLPHATLQDVNVRGFVYDQRSRDQVLNSLNQILKNRQNALNEAPNKREGVLFSPHYVILITDEKLVMDHVIMEFFNEDPSELGCSIIFVQDVMSSLSENVKTVIDIRDRNTGVLLIEEGDLKDTPFQLDHFPKNFNKEDIPRDLAALNHMQTLKSTIPEAITFMEMYNVERIEELNIRGRWAEHSPHKSLAVPLGVRGKDDIVYLNLHEKAHGPHGLVAGTTGSGKSEIIQSYIISLAVNFHPYDVAFLLIDYKGGGMANLFLDLPHLLGTITNLDGAQSMRALVSINAELKRRQRLFSENNVNHINQYQKLYKNGEVKDPMPHLFLISDEFAELKSEQPEFMDELISTARIGRSLGIHLILATQKPSGVVNDQIWSNSKFKLALKVADRSDSMEIIKTPDAAEITQPGRAYLQVGNNEIYELFQSAWSGADYQPDKEDQNIEDYTIYRINELGQYEILNEDLSGLDNVEDIKKIPSELEAVVEGVRQIVEEDQVAPLPRPWLPPLETHITVTDIHEVDFKEAWQEAKQPLKPVIGMVDIPSMQAQETLTLDLTTDGHVAIFASPAYGKSTFIQTLVMDLARSHNPEHLNVYLLDFGTNGLLPLKKLPHVADTMSVDDEEKIGKFVRRMDGEIKRRKKLLSQYSVASLAMYERASGQEEPILLIALDGYEGMKGMPFEEQLDKMITLISREGTGIGIHLVISAGRSNSMRANLSGNIKIQIPLKINDESEARNIVGRTTLVVEDVQGRGLIKLEQPEAFQTALPAAGEDTLQIIDAIQAEAEIMNTHWTGKRPEAIPMVPEILTSEVFMSMPSVQRDIATPYLLPIGIDFEDVQSVSWDSKCGNLLFAYGKAQEGEIFAQRTIAHVHSHNHKVLLFDVPNSSLYSAYDQVDAVASTKEQHHDLLEVIQLKKEKLEEEFDAYKEKNGNVIPLDFYQEKEPIFIVLHHVNKLIATMDPQDVKRLAELMTEGHNKGFIFITTADIFELSKGYDDVTKALKRVEEIILTVKLTEQAAFSVNNKPYKEASLQDSEAYHIINSIAYKIKQVKA